jgi:hypothetical protein
MSGIFRCWLALLMSDVAFAVQCGDITFTEVPPLVANWTTAPITATASQAILDQAADGRVGVELNFKDPSLNK